MERRRGTWADAALRPYLILGAKVRHEELYDELAGIAPRRLVFLDESGVDTRLTRAYARAAPGERKAPTAAETAEKIAAATRIRAATQPKKPR